MGSSTKLNKVFAVRPLAFMAAAIASAAFTLAPAVVRADETCNSPYISKLIKGQEDYVYVWTLGVEGLGDGQDKLVTIDVNPKSKNFGKVLGSVSVGGRGEAQVDRRAADREWLAGAPRPRGGPESLPGAPSARRRRPLEYPSSDSCSRGY